MSLSLPSLRFVLVVLGLLVLRAALAAGDALPAAPLAVRSFAALDIETVPVRPVAAPWLSHLPAHVQVPNAQLRFVAAPVGGLLTALLVGVGETVKEGQPLARLVSPELLALQREVVQSRAERERAQRALARDERLLAEGLIAESRLEASRAADRQAAAALNEKSRLLAFAGARQGPGGELEVLAPMSGVVLSQTARAGERVEPATTLFRIARLDVLELEIELPLGAAPRIAVGRAVRVAATGATGTAIAIGRAVSDAQTLTVRARLTTGLAGLYPGQHVEAEIETAAGRGDAPQWQVPDSALVRLGKGGTQAAVFVRRGEQYVPVVVTPLGQSGADVVVQGPLQQGEPVVRRGASQLKAALAGIGQAE